MTIHPIPDIPNGPVPMTDTRPDTTEADTLNALEAWNAAYEAIMLAWQVTPTHMLETRLTIPRREYSQGIAAQAARSMVNQANQALSAIRTHRHARDFGHYWAADTDAEAVKKK